MTQWTLLSGGQWSGPHGYPRLEGLDLGRVEPSTKHQALEAPSHVSLSFVLATLFIFSPKPSPSFSNVHFIPISRSSVSLVSV